MEYLLTYLLKASLGIVLFYLIYVLLLRKETFYLSNRLYLLFGLITALLLPAFPLTYVTPVQVASNATFYSLTEGSLNALIAPTAAEAGNGSFWKDPITLITSIYIIGALVFFLRLLVQTISVVIRLKYGEKSFYNGVQLVEIKKNVMPFSFFNMVIISTKDYSAKELSNIIAHEKVHIEERHWIDLLLIELLTVLFWFNPIVWLYERSIKQNHEYLADRGVLLAGFSPGQYQALLINQLMGVKILGFTNNLNFSLNKKRMEMMKKEKSSGFKKVKLILVLPVIATLIFAFAKKEHVALESIPISDQNVIFEANQIEELIPIKGTVVDEDGNPMTGANVILKNTNTGTVVDRNGEFELSVPEKCALVVSFIGYKTETLKISANGNVNPSVRIKMNKGVFEIKLPETNGEEIIDIPPPPPPTKGENGEVFTVVEDMPSYKNGGMHGLAVELDEKIEWVKTKTEDRGKAVVGFTVATNGSVIDTHIVESTNSKMLDASALKIIASLNNWNPGIQRGKPVKVNVTLPMEFK